MTVAAFASIEKHYIRFYYGLLHPAPLFVLRAETFGSRHLLLDICKLYLCVCMGNGPRGLNAYFL